MRFFSYILALFICVSCPDPKAPSATVSTKVKSTDSISARTSIPKNTRKDANQVALSIDKFASLLDTTIRRDTVFTYRFKKDSAYQYHAIQVRKPKTVTTYYAVLTKNGREIDRNTIGPRFELFRWDAPEEGERPKLKKSLLDTGIEKIEELGVLYQYEDNTMENSEGESSESYESSITKMLFGKTRDKLIREVLVCSYSSGWYETERDEEGRIIDYWYEDETKESFYLPSEKNGLDNHLVYEMDQLRDRSANGRQEEDAVLDTCEDHYHVKKFLSFKDGIFVEESQKPVFKEVKNEEGVSVKDVPSACWGEEIGRIDFKEKVEVIEMSDFPSRVMNDYGKINLGYWMKIRFPHEADSVGYVFGGDLKYFNIDE